jgi:signal peptidase II
MSRFKKAVLIGVVLFSCVGCDRVTKTVAENHLTSSQPIHLMGDVLQFQYTPNEGGFLGLGAGLPAPVRFWLFTVFVGAALIGALGFVWVSQAMNHPVNILGVSLTIGGGLGNLIDRLLNGGEVVDFVNVGVGDLRTGIFNLADVAIMIGAGVLLVWNALLRKADKSKNDQEQLT